MVQENDKFYIPEEIMQMSVEELRKEREKLYQEIKGDNKNESN